MAIFNRPLGMNVVDNPLVESVFVINNSNGGIAPPSEELSIMTEGGVFIITENGDFLSTE